MYIYIYIYGVFNFLTLLNFCVCLYIFKKNEIGWACGKYWAEERRKQGCGVETLSGFQNNTRNA